jgi:prevent-host-death family protein
MTDLSVRELRNDVSDVLRRVEAGESFRVTVAGRPVANLAPLDRRPRFVSREEFITWPLADSGLRDQLREIDPDTTDDLGDLGGRGPHGG